MAAIARHPTQTHPNASRSDPRTRFAPLESKLQSARLRRGLVARSALVERLKRSSERPVVCVTAPPGYGKTTLIAQWAKADTRPFAWVSLASSDDDPVELLTYVALALNRLEALGGAVFAALSTREPDVDALVLPRLAKALAGVDRRFVLVLDDVHVVHSKASMRALEMLVPHVPAGSQVALASRSEPALPLARLRAQQGLFELGPADLAFDSEAAEALLRAAGVRLGPDDLERITARTEGWPAGLYLAALALKGDGSVVTPVDGFRGDDRLLADYFGEQVLDRLPRGVARFLTRTSILEHLSGDLCDAVLASRDSARKLKRLERSNLFVVPLDRRGVWYRYHGLFGEMLIRRLHEQEPDAEADLHQRASRWYAAHGDADRAIQHAAEAGDIEFAGDLVWAHVNKYLAHGRGATLARWLRTFSADEIAGYPPLALAAAWSALTSGDSAAMDRWAAAAAAGSFEGPLSDGAASLDSAVTLLRAVGAREGIARMQQDAAHAREFESETSAWRASACFLEGVALRLTGRPNHAHRRLAEGQRIAASLGIVKVEALCLAQLAMLAIAEESWDLAASLIARAKSILGEYGLTDLPVVAPVLAASTLVLAHRGAADEARRELRHASQMVASAGTYSWFEVEGRLILARASLLLADAHAARSFLKEARVLMSSGQGLEPFEGTLTELTTLAEALPASGLNGISPLTTAEVRLLHMLPTHFTFREIGERLYLSRNTVKTQAVSIYRKLDVSKRTEAVERARDIGLIEA